MKFRCDEPRREILPDYAVTAVRSPSRIAAARMVLIEHNRLKAELLHFYCANYWGFEVVAVEQTARRGIAAAGRTNPELIIAAAPAPDLEPRDFVAKLRQASPGSKLILLISDCHEYLVHTISATDYHGLISEGVENLRSIEKAIEGVRSGTRFVSDTIARCQTTLRTAQAFPKVLSKREQEMLVCIAHSLSDEEIALRHSLSAATVLSHRQRLMDKLGIHNTPKLIKYCHEKGFHSGVPPPPPRQRGAHQPAPHHCCARRRSRGVVVPTGSLEI